MVRFKEPSLWEDQKEIIGADAGFCLLGLLTMVLLINLGRRRLADKKLRQAELEYRIVADFTYDLGSTGKTWTALCAMSRPPVSAFQVTNPKLSSGAPISSGK